MLPKRFALLLVLFFAAAGLAGPVSASAFYGHCAFYNVAVGRWCRSASNTAMITTREGVGSWEIYNISDAGGGQVTIQELHTGLFLQVLNSSPYAVVAGAVNTLSSRTRFIQTDLGGGLYALKSVFNGQYVRVANDGASLAWYADGGATVDSDYERFRIDDCQVDVWAALTAFATNYPNKVKVKSANNPPGNIALTAETVSGSFQYWYQLIEDYSHNPLGHPVYDKNSLRYIGDWECWVIYGTLAQYINGIQWTEGIPRTRRYFNARIQEDSPRQVVNWYDIDLSCKNINPRSGTEWGRRYVGWMQDLSSGRGQSQVDMGSRWVVRVGYKDNPESWIIDLGPAVGVFAPRYGTVGYINGANLTLWFNNVQDTYNVVPKRCSAY